MEIKVKTLLVGGIKHLAVGTGLGILSYMLGGSFGTVFVLYLVLAYIRKEKEESFK